MSTTDKKPAPAPPADTEFLRSVLASSVDCIKVLDLEGELLFMSKNGKPVMEVSDFNAIGGLPEPGGPAVVPPTRTGFGSQSIERSLADFSAAVRLAYLPTGVTFSLGAPLEDLHRV